MRFALGLLVGLTMSTAVLEHADAQDTKLSRYESDALKRALAQRNLEVDPVPAGKRISAIIVDNQPVFSSREGFLTAFNFFHVTTKESVIDREVLLRPGETWDEDLISESRRKITDPLYSTLVVIAAVKTVDPSKVDLLVVTRDIWSLRLNTLYEFQGDKLTRLSFSFSENNLLGYRKTAALSFQMNQSNIFVGPIYIDKNVMGTRLRFDAIAGPLFSRSSGDFEGTRSNVGLTYPLWSSRSKWSADIGVSHFDSTIRRFRGTEVDLYDNPDTADVEMVPNIYELFNFNLEAGATRSFGHRIIQRVRVGYDLRVNRPKIPGNFEFDDATANALVRDEFPRSERSSAVFFRYNAFLNKFRVYRNVDTYDLPEDVRLGPSFGAVVASSLKVIGSETNFVTGSASLSHTQDVGDGLIRASVSASGRAQKSGGETELVDRVVSGGLTVATPMLGPYIRVVGEAAIAARFNDRANSTLFIGGESGLRGFGINQFEGNRRVRANLEVRSVPLKIWFGRLGAIAFYDVGHAAFKFENLRLQHDVGFGVRSLVPQLQRTVFRFDLAVPLTGDNVGGIRFSAGIRQAF